MNESLPDENEQPAVISTTEKCDATEEINKENKGDENSKTSATSTLCYRLSDMIIIMFLVFPLSIGVWRGIWQIMDHYSVVWNVDPWLSILLGYLIPFFMYYFQGPLKSHVVPGKIHFIWFYIISRTLLIIHAVGGINMWRGMFEVLDASVGKGDFAALVTLSIGAFFNIIFRTFNNLLSPPLHCCVDEADAVYDCPVRFQTPPTKRLKYVFDILFSMIVIPILTIFCWRGLWYFVDNHLFPKDELMSSITSMEFGYIICILLCSVQPRIHEFVSKLTGYKRLLVIDLTNFVGFVGCVLAWRGIWMLYDIFIVFDSSIPCLSEWVTATVGIVFLTLLGSLSTVSDAGLYVDGETEDHDEEWLISYISLLRTRVDNVPFPEPWICRWICTSQKMNTDKMSVCGKRCKLWNGNLLNTLKNTISPNSTININDNCQKTRNQCKTNVA